MAELYVKIYTGLGETLEEQELWSKVFMGICAAFTLPMFYLIHRAAYKEAKIVTPQGQPYAETYCVLTLHLLRLAAISLIFHIIGLIYQICMLSMDPKQLHIFFYFGRSRYDTFCLPFTWDRILSTWKNPFYLLKLAGILPIQTCLDLIAWIQSAEWAAMYYTIVTQKDRSVQQIQQDFEQENVDESIRIFEENGINSELILYRRLEMRLHKCYLYGTIVFTLFSAAIYSMLMMFYSTWFWALLAQRIILLLTTVISYSGVMSNMRRMHRYEYERNTKSMCWMFWVTLVSIAVRLFYATSSLAYYMDDQFQEVQCSPETEDPEVVPVIGPRWFQYLLHFCTTYDYLLCASNLILSLAIIRMKSSQDILQGLSKLDHLLKVSVFQKYKSSFTKLRLTLGRASTFRRTSSVTSSSFIPETEESLRGSGEKANARKSLVDEHDTRLHSSSINSGNHRTTNDKN